MNICFVIGRTTYESSLYLATKDVSDEMIRLGHQVSYIFFEEQQNGLKGSDEYYYIKGITKTSFKGGRGLLLKVLKKLLSNHIYLYIFSSYFSKQIAEKLSQYDAVFIHGQSCIPLNKLKEKVFFVAHSAKYENLVMKQPWYKRKIYQGLYRNVYTGAQLLTVSKGVKQDLLNKIKAKPKRIEVVYNGFDFQLMKDRAAKSTVSGLPDKFIMAAGRPDRTKRFDILMKAYALTQRTHKLVIFGDGRGLKKLRKLSVQLGIEDDVIFWGFCDNILACFPKADAYVLSSDIEGLPTVIIESLALKTPVVATDACGVKELLQNELSHWIVPRRDVVQLAQKIDEILECRPLVSEKNIAFLSADNIVNNYLFCCEKSNEKV